MQTAITDDFGRKIVVADDVPYVPTPQELEDAKIGETDTNHGSKALP